MLRMWILSCNLTSPNSFLQTPFWSRLRVVCLVAFWLLWLGLLAAVVVLTVIMPRCLAPSDKTWSEHSVVYDIYVPSFYDTDADGMGDIKGNSTLWLLPHLMPRAWMTLELY